MWQRGLLDKNSPTGTHFFTVPTHFGKFPLMCQVYYKDIVYVHRQLYVTILESKPSQDAASLPSQDPHRGSVPFPPVSLAVLTVDHLRVSQGQCTQASYLENFQRHFLPLGLPYNTCCRENLAFLNQSFRRETKMGLILNNLLHLPIGSLPTRFSCSHSDHFCCHG